jgi:hypothetical protein
MVPEDTKPTPNNKDKPDLQSPEVQIAWARMVARASVDEPFLERLRASPADVFEEFGITLDREVDLNKDFSPPLDEVLASIERQRAQAASVPPAALNNALQASTALIGSASTFCGNPFCGCMCKGTTMTAASGNVVTPVSDVSPGASSQALMLCVSTHATATQPCSQSSCMCYPCVAATPLSPSDSGMANRVGSSTSYTNATVSGCFCGQYCSTTSTMMSTPLEGRLASGMPQGGTTGMQDALVSGRSAGTMATSFCMSCQACACFGTNGACWGSFPVCAATLGFGGNQTAATTSGTYGTMSSTPLSGGIAGGGTMSSFGTGGSFGGF